MESGSDFGGWPQCRLQFKKEDVINKIRRHNPVFHLV